jgi:primosomal protein N' (replication factor Y)
LPRACPSCGSNRLDFRGPGTERIERFLQQRFAAFPILRIDRDTVTRKQALPDFLAQINTGKPCVLVGTQMLAKGHHFPNVTLVVIVDADGGLFSADFRGPERVGQLLMQVAGRAGRGDHPGRVLIQSAQADHPLLQQLIGEGYEPFARQLLLDRQRLGLPPHGSMALLRADATELKPAEQLLREARRYLASFAGLELIGPLPAPMTRRAGRMRVQLQIIAPQRPALQRALDGLVEFIAAQKLASRLRWSLDVDPQDMF